MEWGKAKTILIIFFAFVNIFLYVRIFSESIFESGNEESTDGVIEILNRNNITIDKDIIPKENYYLEQFNVTNDVKSASEILKLTFPDVKNVKSTDDNFSFQYSTEKFSNLSEKKSLNFVKSELKNNRILTDTDYKIFSVLNNDGTYSVTYSPSFNGENIVDIRLVFNINKNGTVKVNGYNWLIDSIEGTENVIKASSVTEVLLNFANDGEVKKILPVKITGVDIKYYVGSRDGEISTVTALPVWRISTDKNKYFYFDIRDGKKIEE